uniref:Uncharacterized protein n=1 Tax=Oryza brachyantha TaxID=4533 RepID=J3MEG4_ORYBR
VCERHICDDDILWLIYSSSNICIRCQMCSSSVRILAMIYIYAYVSLKATPPYHKDGFRDGF